jgi:hypothetical protein
MAGLPQRNGQRPELAEDTLPRGLAFHCTDIALVWGSEFTTKGAALQGDSAEIAPTLNVILWDPVVTGGGAILAFWNSQSTEIKSRRGTGHFESRI